MPVDTIDSASILSASQDDSVFFVPGMEYGVEYFVVIAVGDELAGTTDLNDPCLSLSEVASISFIQNPEVSFVLDEQAFCEEESVVVAMSIQHSTCADIIISDGLGNTFEFYSEISGKVEKYENYEEKRQTKKGYDLIKKIQEIQE